MRAFTRTPSGLSSLHAFHGCDVVVFVEGGNTTYTVQEALRGEWNNEAVDIVFWHRICTIFIPQIRVHIRALGGNGAVRQIGKMISAGQVTNVLAATDRDFDHLFPHLPQHDGCLTTMGYSWENDACCIDTLEEVLYSNCFLDRHLANLRAKAEPIVTSMLNDLSPYVLIDFLFVAAEERLFPRDRPAAFIENIKKQNTAPTVNTSRIASVIRDVRSRLRPFRPICDYNKIKASLNVYSDCCGHMIFEVYYRALCHILVRYARAPKMQIDSARLAFIREFALHLEQPSEIREHYQGQFAWINRLLADWGLPAAPMAA